MQSSLLFWNIGKTREAIAYRPYPRSLHKSYYLNFFIDTGTDISVFRYCLAHDFQMLLWKTTLFFSCKWNKNTHIWHKTLKIDLNLRREFPWFFVIGDVLQPIIDFDLLKYFDLHIDVIQNSLIDKLNFHLEENCLPSAISQLAYL